MYHGIIGRKIGMTQIFTDEGRMEPVTVIQAGPCQVVRTKSKDKDGYEALQLGFESQKPKRVNKPDLGQYTKRELKPFKVLREVRVEDASQYTIGQDLNLDGLKEVQWVDVIGTSKGKGFQGVMKRHNFKGQGASHGAHRVHRAHGSVGQGSTPSRVFPGVKMAGQMGNVRVTAQKLRVVEVDAEKNLVLIRGSVPGGKRGVVIISESKKGKK